MFPYVHYRHYLKRELVSILSLKQKCRSLGLIEWSLYKVENSCKNIVGTIRVVQTIIIHMGERICKRSINDILTTL